MGEIDYKRFNRLLTRSAEVAGEPGISVGVTRVYNEVLKAAGDAFQAAHKAVTDAETRFEKEAKEAHDALAALDKPYAETRSVVKAFVPTAVVPETLKSQKTDTDKMTAIQDLLEVLEDYDGQAWAEEQQASPFGQQAPQTLVEVQEAIAANKQLSTAMEARASAYGPAYERYLRFKNVVRNAHGSKSKQYKRIHLRRRAEADDDGDTGEPTGTVPAETVPAETGEKKPE